MIIMVYCKNLRSMQKTLARLYQVEDKNPLVITKDLTIKLSEYSGIKCESFSDLINEITLQYWFRKTQNYYEAVYEHALRDGGDNDMKGKEWTDEENYITLRDDLTFKDKAELLNRSVKSVITHYYRLKKWGSDYKVGQAEVQRILNKQGGAYTSPKSIAHDRWTKEEIEFIMNNPEMSDKEISKQINRSAHAVVQRRYLLNKNAI